MRQYLDKHILPFVQKPGRYLGNEWNTIRKDPSQVKVKIALAFPDLYEVGMSHLGIKILYHILNEQHDVACERVFAPGLDMEELLRQHQLPLFSLESARPLSEFEIIGFSLTYELSYTNVINMLELANIPCRSAKRDNTHPLIIAGGPCVCNPEPLAEFIDVFCIGEAEEMILELVQVCRDCLVDRPIEEKSLHFSSSTTGGYLDNTSNRRQTQNGLELTQKNVKWKDRNILLHHLSRIEGIYVPSLYEVKYPPHTTVRQLLIPKEKDIPLVIHKRFIHDLDKAPYPVNQPVPFIEVIHDRISLEIMRGCPAGCRFCQARVFYHPLRPRSVKNIINLAQHSYSQTGYEEISLVSLASGCHPQITEVITGLENIFKPLGVKISLPSLRIESVQRVLPLLDRPQKLSLTIAPEAGTDRMLKLINKKITCSGIMDAVKEAYKLGWKRIKLYFMIGLPEEREEDLRGIANLVQSISNLKRHIDGRPAELTVSISSFIPKPHTWWQREPMESIDNLQQKQRFLRRQITGRRIKLNFHDVKMSYVEALLCRSDRRLAEIIYQVWQKGARFEAWKDHFNFSLWQETCDKAGLDTTLFVNHRHQEDEILPWQHIKIP